MRKYFVLFCKVNRRGCRFVSDRFRTALIMSEKEQFEHAWFSHFHSGSNGASPPVPSLSCWDSAGKLRSQEALRDELEKCRRRIAELRQNLRAEEFIEFYCQQALNRQRGTALHAVAKRSASLPVRPGVVARSKSPTTAVQVEGIYSEPIDSRLTGKTNHNQERPESTEGLYSEPVDARGLCRIPSVPEPLYSKPVNSKPLTAAKREKRHVYEEINDVLAEKADGADNSSEDEESVANLMAIRQSVSRLSQWCVDGDMTRRKLEMQAQRLSKRFSSYAVPASGPGLMNSGLDSVPESLFSPITPSGMMLYT